jgi:hypothetical protein
MKYHKLSEIFPFMQEEEFEQLVQDIKIHGLREQITLFNGEILDGRNRYRACLKAGREPAYWIFEGDEKAARDYVISQNLHRRHLTKELRREIIRKIVEADPLISNVKLGEKLRLDKETIRKERKQLEKSAILSPVSVRARHPRRSDNPVPPGEPDPPPPSFPRLELTEAHELINELTTLLHGKTGKRLKEVLEAVGSSKLEREHGAFIQLIRALDALIQRAQDWKQKLITPKTVELRRIK